MYKSPIFKNDQKFALCVNLALFFTAENAAVSAFNWISKSGWPLRLYDEKSGIPSREEFEALKARVEALEADKAPKTEA